MIVTRVLLRVALLGPLLLMTVLQAVPADQSPKPEHGWMMHQVEPHQDWGRQSQLQSLTGLMALHWKHWCQTA